MRGVYWVDEHHSVDDLAMGLALSVKSALGQKSGIELYGY